MKKKENFDRSAEIAQYYGFYSKPTPEITKADVISAKTLSEGDFVDIDSENEDSRFPLHVEEKIATLRTYMEQEWFNLSQPVSVYFRGGFKNPSEKSNDKFHRFGDLEILGAGKSIAEAILIQTAVVMLKEAGHENICVDINSVGDKESIAKFTKDLTTYYRKHISDLDAECRQAMKRDIFEVYSCRREKCRIINDSAPKPMTYLSDISRTHFKEVLEYLESLGVNFKINERLLGNRKYCTETIYEIVDLDEKSAKNRTLAVGFRYDGLAKKISIKKDIPCAGISLLLKPDPKNDLQREVKKVKKPLVYFIQLGFEAKLLSLKLIEILRQAKIPVYQALAKDKLASQIATAEKMRIPFTILVGKKEVMDNTVIVRRMDTHAQEIVRVEDLSKYMKEKISTISE